MISLCQVLQLQLISAFEEYVANGRMEEDCLRPMVEMRDAFGLKPGDVSFDGFWSWNGTGLILTDAGRKKCDIYLDLCGKIHTAERTIEYMKKNGASEERIQERVKFVSDCRKELGREFPEDNSFTVGNPMLEKNIDRS